MKGSIRLFSIFDIAINIHITFALLLILFLSSGIRWLSLIAGIFCFVTAHELCHALVAKRFGIQVREITLLPIGGVASMTRTPERPAHELLISIAGPAFNIAVILAFYFPMKYLLGPETLFHPLSTATWPLTAAYLYWINLVLAAFNLIPAFPMDGGRVLRAALSTRIGYQKATRLAVNFGHVFALLFAYLGITRVNLMLIAIAVFIYTAASSEETQADVREVLKKFKVRDILPRDFLTISSEATLAKVLELMFHSHQEDFPIVDGGKPAGFMTRQDIMTGIHRFGTEETVRSVMRTEYPCVNDSDSLERAQNAMQESELRALPVMRDGSVVGVVTFEDIGRVYSMASRR